MILLNWYGYYSYWFNFAGIITFSGKYVYVISFDSKLKTLLAMFPENEILIQLFKLSSKIISFHLHIPLGKMLAAIEVLYRTCAEWEQFAASNVSLHKEMELLKDIISRWRLRELNSWSSCQQSQLLATSCLLFLLQST